MAYFFTYTIHSNYPVSNLYSYFI